MSSERWVSVSLLRKGDREIVKSGSGRLDLEFPEVMGAFITDGSPGRAVYIFFRNVMRGVGLNPDAGRLPTQRERRQLRQGLARVVAHEVVHALAPSQPHAPRGLMCRKLNRSLLLLGSPLDHATVNGLREVASGMALARRPGLRATSTF